MGLFYAKDLSGVCGAPK